jgi:hypothetical protein
MPCQAMHQERTYRGRLLQGGEWAPCMTRGIHRIHAQHGPTLWRLAITLPFVDCLQEAVHVDLGIVGPESSALCVMPVHKCPLLSAQSLSAYCVVGMDSTAGCANVQRRSAPGLPKEEEHCVEIMLCSCNWSPCAPSCTN